MRNTGYGRGWSRRAPWCAVTLALAGLISCGGDSTPPTASTPGGGGTTITITSSGASPKSVTVSPGSQLTFVNRDSIAHLMYSDPHPDHMDCPELNQVGFLAPGETRQTGNLNTVRTCGFHDHDLPLVTGLQGSVVIR